MQELRQLDIMRHWEQYTLSGKRNIINYGKLLSYLSNIRKIQGEVGCGKVYTSTYLGVEPRNDIPEKQFILVIEMLQGRGSTYKNQPISLAKIVIGWRQVVFHLKDLQTRKFNKYFVFNTEEPMETVKEILDWCYDEGLHPMETSDYFFGQYRTELQFVFDNIVDRLEEEDLKVLKGLLTSRGFEFVEDFCKKSFGNFVIRIYQKNRYGSYIIAFQDLEEKTSVHWAAKGEDLVNIVDGLVVIYDIWKSRIKGAK